MSIEYREVPLATSGAEYHELFLDAFPEKKDASIAGAEHYAWKFLQQPGPAAPLGYAAFEETTPAGFYGAIPLSYRAAGRTMTAALICDVMTASSMRGRGIFTRMGRCAIDDMAKRGIDFLTGYPIRPEVIPGHLKVGWKILFRLPIFLKVVRSRAILERAHCGLLAPLGDIGALAYRGAAKLFRAGTRGVRTVSMDIATLLARPDLAAFLERWSEQGGHRLIRTTDLLRWRLSAPAAQCEAVVALDGDRLVGLALASHSDVRGVPVLTVLDFLLLPGFAHASGALHDALETLAVRAGLSCVGLMTTAEKAAEWELQSNGYLRSPFVYDFILRWLVAGEMPASIASAAEWHLTWFDTDCF